MDQALGSSLQWLVAPVLAHPVRAVVGTGLLTILVRLVVSPLQATPALTVALIPIFMNAGYNPLTAVIAIMAASTTFVAPRLSPGYVAMMAGTRERMFTDRQVMPLALLHSFFLLLSLLVSVPFWIYLSVM